MYRERPHEITRLKEYLLAPFPDVPPESVYAPYLASPRLELSSLLPPYVWDDHWGSFHLEMHSWLRSLTGEEPLPSSIQRHTRLDVEMLDIVLPLVEKGERAVCFREGRTGLQFGNPDVRVLKDSACLLVGVMDLEMSNPLLARLFTYMSLSGAQFGVVATLSETAFCKLEGSRLLVSSTLPRPATMGYGYVLEQARLAGTRPVTLPLTPLAPIKDGLGFQASYLKTKLLEMCRDKKTPHLAQIMRDVQHLNFEDISEYGNVLMSAENASVFALTTRTAVYKGKQVVIKLWDMTSPWDFHGPELTMAHMFAEVNALMHLRKLQGLYVIPLVSWGFMHGGMFCYVITSYEGRRWGEGFALPGLSIELPNLLEGVRKIHARGIIHGDVCASKVVVSEGPGGKPSVKLTGFGNSYIPEDQNKKALEMARELIEFEKVVDFLRTRCPS